MKLLKYLITFLGLEILQLIGVVIVGIALLFLPKPATKLPWFLKWFDNNETYWGGREAGLNGTLIIDSQTWWSRWIWLCWRNPVNYFQYHVLGFTWNKPIFLVSYDPKLIATVGDDKGEGSFYTEVVIDSKVRWEYRRTRRWGQSGKCLDIRLGWKISSVESNMLGSQVQWVFNIRLIVDYTGK